MGEISKYSKELTAYSRKSLKDIYFFASKHPTPQALTARQQIVELLAFGSDEQLNEIGKRIFQAPAPYSLIAEIHGQYWCSSSNPIHTII